MNFLELAVLAVGCMAQDNTIVDCWRMQNAASAVSAVTSVAPYLSGSAVDVVLSAESALVWEPVHTHFLYEKNTDGRRPIASLSKLLTVLSVRQKLSSSSVVVIPEAVRAVQRQGAHIGLVPGEHARVDELLAATLIASANDAAFTLAEAAFGSQEAFVVQANDYALKLGLRDTHVTDATGLLAAGQYSTARDVARLLDLVYEDSEMRPWLAQKTGSLVTTEGTRRSYKSTNQLLGTYLPIIAAKTGYTLEAGENLAIFTENAEGVRLGAVILGSKQRFQDMKVLVEWVWRNYTWNNI